jgi:hypothetical protein
MRQRMFMLAVIFLSFASVPMSWAQTVYIGSSDSHTVVLEVRTIKKKSGYIQVWAEYNDLNITSKSTSLKALMRIRCDEEEMATASTVRYSKSHGMGDVISSANQDYPSYSPVVPDSIGESILSFVCAYEASEPWALEAVKKAIDAAAAAESAASAADAAAGGSRNSRVKRDNP